MPSTKRFDLVRNRLRWAKNIHQWKGIIGSGEGEQTTMRQLLEFYRSNQWQRLGVFDGLPPDVLRIVNKIFPIANRQEAGIAAQNPRVSYFPRKKEAEETAPVAELLHNYDISEQNHIAQFRRAFSYAQFAPTPGWVRHGYTPPEELTDDKGRALGFYRPANPNRPWIKAVAPWDCLVDPRAETWHMDGGAQWCAFRSVHTKSQLLRNPNLHLSKRKLEGVAGNVSQPYRDMMPEELKQGSDPDQGNYLEVWTYYDLEDRTWMQLLLDGLDEWVRPPGEWPIPWEWLPLNGFIVNGQIDTPFTIALLQDLVPLQQELNQVRTMMGILARNIRRTGFFNKVKLADSSSLLKDAALIEWFGVDGDPKDAVFQVQTGGFPQELLVYANQIIDDMRESVGLSLFARARRENVESATEAAAISQGQDVMESRTQECFDRFMNEAESLYMQGRRAILTETGDEEPLRILGADARQIQGYVTADAETLAGEFDFEVVAGSTRARDKESEAQRAAVDMQVAAGLPFAKMEQFAIDYLRLRGKDPSRYLDLDAGLASAVQGAGQIAGGAPNGAGGGGPIDPNIVQLLQGAG